MFNVNTTLDAKGLACPMPLVKTKKKIDEMNAGEVLKILATDQGSTADLKAWARRSGHEYLETRQEGEILQHYLRKAGDVKPVEVRYPTTVSNDELQEKLKAGAAIVLDVRERSEYVVGHIPSAICIPLGELEDRLDELNKESHIHLICRSGNRSDLAAKLLLEHKFSNVFNVVPGMSQWTGEMKRS